MGAVKMKTPSRPNCTGEGVSPCGLPSLEPDVGAKAMVTPVQFFTTSTNAPSTGKEASKFFIP